MGRGKKRTDVRWKQKNKRRSRTLTPAIKKKTTGKPKRGRDGVGRNGVKTKMALIPKVNTI